jgi:hypothetical protein
MTFELFQTIYVYFSLVLVLLLSAYFQKKESCTCHIKTPASAVAFLTTIALGYINGFTPLTFTLMAFLFTGMVGSILFGKVGKVSGGIAYLIGFIIMFMGFEIFGIKEIINMGFQNVSVFGALLAITIMFLKKQDNVITVYILGLSIFFLTAVFSGILPLVLGAILISLSEIMLIYNNDFQEELPETMFKKTTYFAAGLYSYGMLLIPLALL